MNAILVKNSAYLFVFLQNNNYEKYPTTQFAHEIRNTDFQEKYRTLDNWN